VSFFTDLLSGGGDLHRSIVPRELRNLAPKEIQPGGFNPGRDYLGIDLDGTLAQEAMAKARAAQAQQQAAAQSQFNQSANAPIPGLLGMAPPPAAIPGLIAPRQNQIQDQQQQPSPFSPMGPYGQIAAQMAGLLGNRGFVDPNDPKNQPGPMYRPPGK